jgi:hypothetical protein
MRWGEWNLSGGSRDLLDRMFSSLKPMWQGGTTYGKHGHAVMEPKMLATFLMRRLYLHVLFVLDQLAKHMHAAITLKNFFESVSFTINGQHQVVHGWPEAPLLSHPV